jgi:outer membrane protein assembly factor BamB
MSNAWQPSTRCARRAGIARSITRVLPRVITAVAVVAFAACGAGEAARNSGDATPTQSEPTFSEPVSSILALDRRWVAPGPRDPQAIVADDQGVVAIGRYGEMVALDRRGRPQWTSTIVGAGEQTADGAALGSDVVILPVTPGRVVAVDRARGDLRWSTAIQNPRRVAIDPEDPSVIGVLTAGGILEGLDLGDGGERWSTQVAFGERAEPVSVGVRSGRVVVAWADVGGSHVQVFDAVTGAEQWSVTSPRFSGTPAVTDAAVVVSENLEADGRHTSARIVRLDLATGARVWAHPVDGPFLPDLRVAAGRDAVAVVDVPGTLTLLDLETGAPRWSRRTRLQQFVAAPALVGDVVAMTTYATGLVAVAAADGSAVGNDAPGRVQTAVSFEGSAPAGPRLYLLGGRGQGEGEVWMLSAGGVARAAR